MRLARHPSQPSSRGQDSMNKLYLTLAAVIAVVLGAGALFLAAWDIPAPTSRVEKVIPYERLGQ